jgi:hypothetical protein
MDASVQELEHKVSNLCHAMFNTHKKHTKLSEIHYFLSEIELETNNFSGDSHDTIIPRLAAF